MFDAFNVGWIKRFVGCGKITDGPQVEDPVYATFEQSGNRFRFRKVGGNIFSAQALKKRYVLSGPGCSPDANPLLGKKFNKVTPHKPGRAGNEGNAIKFHYSLPYEDDNYKIAIFFPVTAPLELFSISARAWCSHSRYISFWVMPSSAIRLT